MSIQDSTYMWHAYRLLSIYINLCSPAPKRKSKGKPKKSSSQHSVQSAKNEPSKPMVNSETTVDGESGKTSTENGDGDGIESLERYSITNINFCKMVIKDFYMLYCNLIES